MSEQVNQVWTVFPDELFSAASKTVSLQAERQFAYELHILYKPPYERMAHRQVNVPCHQPCPCCTPAVTKDRNLECASDQKPSSRLCTQHESRRYSMAIQTWRELLMPQAIRQRQATKGHILKILTANLSLPSAATPPNPVFLQTVVVRETCERYR